MDPVSITLTAVGWLMSCLVNKAVTALLEAWLKQIGLGDEFETLEDQLLQLGALLENARGLPTNNSFLEKLVQKLQQLVNKAENLLDELDYYRLEDQIQQTGTQDKVNCSNKSSASSSSSGFRLASCSMLSTLKGMSCFSAKDALISKPDTSSRINLSRRMKDLAEQLQKSKEEVRKAVNTKALVKTVQNTERSQSEATNILQTTAFPTEPIVFGRDQELDKLMNILTNEEMAKVGKVPVLAIVGNGGIGKTTLARLVFNDPKVHSYFEVKSWICVSTQFDSVRLTREMLEAACGNRYGELCNLHELQNKLKEKLESKKFLLVLDDMWEYKDKPEWDSMVAPLNYCSVKGSIILVTTRNQSVAEMVDIARDNIIHLQGLDENAFLSFFSTCIFNGPNYGGNLRLRNIGAQIAKKLKGNPLAAKTVSALLKKNPDERYWMQIRDSEEWKSQSGQNHIMPALRLSYEHMPFHLQRCFSYCAIFPEDQPFTCEELVYQWMAQGYLDVRFEGTRMEDIGRAYFNDLFNGGFFQTIQSRHDNEVHYTFHDLIHDLAHMVASKECLTINDPKSRKIPPTIRHLLNFNSTKMAENEEAIVKVLECLEGENLSTIFNWDELPSRISRSILDLLKKTKYLRAMRLDLCRSAQLHNCYFQNFVSLRYLRFSMFDFDNCWTLPREICRIYHLQVLEIKDGHLLDELPNNFSDLVSLRHFIVKGKLHSKILGVGKLTSLQELNYFHVQQNNGFEIEQLGSLKEIGGSLQISNLENIKSEREANKARLAEKGKLDALYLKWNHGEQENGSVLVGLKPNTNLKLLEIDGYGGVASPTWLDPSLIFLESLTLENCKAWELLPPIGDLEFLKRFKLSGLAVREIGPQCYGTCQSMKFQSLEELEIIDMPDLEKWVWSDQLQQFQCFKKLIKLTIRNCKALELIPPIGELEFLKHLELSGMAVKEIGAQCYGTRQSMKFPSLENLKITDMLDLEKWVWSDQLQLFLCFKKLKKLTIRGCPKLVDLPLSGSATSEVLERFPSLEGLIIEGCPLIFQLPPLPYSSLLSFISIKETKFIKSMRYYEKWKDLSLILDQNLSLQVVEVLAFNELSSLHSIEISNISSLESLDLHSFVVLEELVIEECQSLTSLTFGDQLVCLRSLEIRSCKTLSSIKGIKSWVNLNRLYFRECPGFIAAWDSAAKEIERTEADFSLSLTEIHGDSLALLTLPICKQLSSLHDFELEFSSFTEEHEVSPQFLTSLDLVDIRGCKKNLQSFPFDLFPSLKIVTISFPHIESLSLDSHTDITEECLKLRNIEEVHIFRDLVQIWLTR